jgi:hypothetical protein
MEIYMAAIVSFYLKPRRRLWKPDGVKSLVEITAPTTIEVHRTKDLSQGEAEQRLSYLANIVDTGGWAVRGVASPQTNSAMQTDAYFEAQQTVDILDDSGGVAQSFDTMINQADAKRRQDIMARLANPTPQPAAQPVVPPVADPYTTLQPPTQPEPSPPEPQVSFNPYPAAMHQSVIQPLSQQPATPTPQPAPAQPPSTSAKPVSPDIINLANNADLSIETIAHEAKRIQQKEQKLSDDEVVISLR